jgi:hypothetical protein
LMQAVAVVAAFVLVFALAVVLLRRVANPDCQRAALGTPMPGHWDERCWEQIRD